MIEDTTTDHQYGTVITFYSYKGGVGRSMALSNIGCLMALEDKKVLLIDWDLEAPGLEKYFLRSENPPKDTRTDSLLRERPGIVDLLEGLATGSSVTWQECVSTVEFLGTSVDIITAGRRDENYRKRVQSINWGILYEEYDFGAFMEEFREEITDEYDYILIDSRTGITDIGDVCTVLLPDVLVTLFVSNEQNIEGSLQVVERARKARSRLPVDRSNLMVLPLSSRDESDAEYDLASSWRARYATDFRKLLGEWLPREVSAEDYFDRIYVPYVAVWSFGERLPVIESRRELRDPKSLGVSLQNVSRLLVNQLDWYALGDQRNLSQVTAAKTELRAVEERYAVDTAKLQMKASSFRRRAFLMGGSAAAAIGAGGFLLWDAWSKPVPSIALTLSSRRSLGSGISVARFSDEDLANGSLLGTGRSDGAVFFNDPDSNNVWDAIPWHTDRVESIVFTPDHAATGAADGGVRVWNPYEQRSIGESKILGQGSIVNSVAFSPDGRRIVSGSDDNTLRIWDVQSGEELQVLRGHESYVTSVAFSSDGRSILSGSQDYTLRIWDAQSGEELQVLQGHERPVTSVAFSTDGRRILSGSYDNTLRIWDAKSGEELQVLQGHESDVTSVAFSPDGHRILSGSRDNTLRLWDAQSGEELKVLQGHKGGVTSVAFSPDGRRILSGSYDTTLRIWDAQSGAELQVLQGHEGWVSSVAISPDGRRILSGSEDNTLRIWDALSGAGLQVLQGHEDYATSVAFSPDGRRILSGSWDRTLRIWDAQSGKPIAFEIAKFETGVTSLAYAPDKSRLFAGTRSGEIAVLAPTAVEPVLSVTRAHATSITAIVLSPDGLTVANAAEHATISLRSATDLSLRIMVEGHTAPVSDLAFSPDGTHLASASLDGTVRLSTVATGMSRREIRIPDNIGATRLAYSPDGTRLAVGGQNGTIWIMDTVEASIIGTLPASTTNLVSAIIALSYRPEGRSISFLSADGVLFTADLVALAM
ncbi:MAG: AAA family ATPase [Aliishimia sp.]